MQWLLIVFAAKNQWVVTITSHQIDRVPDIGLHNCALYLDFISILVTNDYSLLWLSGGISHSLHVLTLLFNAFKSKLAISRENKQVKQSAERPNTWNQNENPKVSEVLWGDVQPDGKKPSDPIADEVA